MFIIKKIQNEIFSLPTTEFKLERVSVLKSKLAQRILQIISQAPAYPKEIAKKLKLQEQSIYYHINQLKKAGIIKVVKKETKQGGIANYYDLVQPSFFIKFKEFKSTPKLTHQGIRFLEPFIKNGQLDAIIIVGSPDPHGPEKARSRDGYYGIDFALFLGTFLNYVPHFNVKLDTEVREEDLKNNLILIGGPVVNKITERVNNKLPIRFEKGNIKSTISNKTYYSDESGLIVKTRNPFNPKKFILVIAGKRFSGTRAAIIAFLKDFKKIRQGNIYQSRIKAKVVEGIDLDSDSIIDDVEFLE